MIESLAHYIIVRRDLAPPRRFGSRLGVTAAQITHAAGESYAEYVRNVPRAPSGPTYAIVLGVPDERTLKRVERTLRAKHIRHVAIREPDAPWNGQLMTIGLWPVHRTSASFSHLSKLKLL